MTTPKLLYFVSEDWYFCSHRLSLALAAKDAGYDVTVVTRVSNHGQHIRNAGLRVVKFDMSRHAMNPLSELAVLFRLIMIYRKEKPDIVHHVAMKPVLYGTLAARFCGVGCIVNALAGMGWLFSSDTRVARLMKLFVTLFFRALLPSSQIIVQNREDAQFMRDLGCRHVHVIRGAGVDVNAITPSPEPPGVVVVLLAARMLWDKGVGEYVAAARLLKARGSHVRMLLAGEPDECNPASIPSNMLKSWHDSNIVEWLGYRNNIPALLASSHIVCLPSYREGLPKFLLEGMAGGRPIVTTDVPGCRDTVRPNENGFLVPVRNPEALADTLEKLIGDKQLREKMGKSARDMALHQFSSTRIEAETLAVYNGCFT